MCWDGGGDGDGGEPPLEPPFGYIPPPPPRHLHPLPLSPPGRFPEPSPGPTYFLWMFLRLPSSHFHPRYQDGRTDGWMTRIFHPAV